MLNFLFQKEFFFLMKTLILFFLIEVHLVWKIYIIIDVACVTTLSFHPMVLNIIV